MRKIVYIISCLIAIHSFVEGQVKFYTQVSENTVLYRHTFQVQYIVEGSKDIKQFTLPNFNDFLVEEVFDIENTPTLNQQTMQKTDTYYKVVVLSPTKNGRFTIQGAAALIDGKLMHSNKTNVTVQQGGFTGMHSNDEIDADNESELRPGEDINEKIRKNFFLHIDVNKTTCYVGEPLMVVYKAFTRLNTNSTIVRRPSFTGFSVVEMVDDYDAKAEIEKYNGIPYYMNVIRKVQLFPLQEGEFILDPAEVESTIHFIKIDNPPSISPGTSQPYDNISSHQLIRTPLDHHTIFKTEPLAITVKPLPTDGQPADFSGAVGNFSIAEHLSSSVIHKGDLVKVIVDVNGSGNLSLLGPPLINWPKNMDTAEPVVREKINKYVYPLTGSKTFEYSFTAPDTGIYVLPAASLSYYDLVQKTYKTATCNSVNLHVLASIDNADAQKEAGEIISNKEPGIPRHLYWFAVVVVVIVGWITYQSIRLHRSRKAEEEKSKKVVEQVEEKDPVKVMLVGAKWALAEGNAQLFYQELERTMWDMVALKYNLLPSAMNKQNLAYQLRKKGVNTETTGRFMEILNECEWARYTPGQEDRDRQNLMERAEVVLILLHST
jgi:hypothetical protein